MDEVIDGYVYSGPPSFGEFFPEFEALGAAETASANTFACALQKLQGQVGNKELNPNELLVVTTAMKLLFKYLCNNTGASLDLCSLFLPNCDNIMTLSTKLVFSDNQSLRQRVKKLKLNFFVGFRKLEIDEINPLRTISLLPPEHRPTILSEVMKEQLTDTCTGSARKGSISSKILTVIQAPEFISGLVRLVNHEKIMKYLKPLERADCEKHNLSNIEIFEVEHLETCIIYNENIVEGSECTQTCFTDKEQQSLCIYISTNVMTIDEESLYSNLSFAINALTGRHLGESVATLVRLLKCEPQMIHKILDTCNITAFDYTSSPLYRTVFPPPGTIVPEKFHFMLDNSFSYFKEGEYAGYEVYDPLIDDEGDDLTGEMEAGDVFIVYVIIMKVVTLGETPLQARYIIEGKDGTKKEVCATQLYKFFRNTEDGMIERSTVSPDSPLEVPLALADVLREIRNTLKEAWAMLGERDRNRVKKRLYFKWHPDKNPGRSDFCNEVCKYIGIYIERLEKGLTIDDIHDETGGGSSTDYSWFHRFNDRTSRHRSYQREYQQSHQHFRGGSCGSGSGYGSGYGSGSYHQSEGNPDLSEARRWLRQAKADLDAGRKVLGLSMAYNWICFMGQQDVEEAIVCLIEGALWEEALRMMHRHRRTDFIETNLKTALLECHEQHLETLEEYHDNFEKHKKRLSVVREQREKQKLEILDDDVPCNNMDSDLFSDTSSATGASVQSSQYSYNSQRSTVISRRTGHSSKSRKKGDKPRWSLKEGSQYEDCALIDALAKIITAVDSLKEEVNSLMRALVQFHYDALALSLHQQLDSFLTLIDKSIPCIWLEESSQDAHPVLGPNMTSNAIAQAMQQNSSSNTREQKDPVLMAPPKRRKDVRWRLHMVHTGGDH